MKAEIYFDGACWNKEGYQHLMGIGVAVFLDNEYQEELSRAIHLEDPGGSNNIAEWEGCVEAMKIAGDLVKEGYTVKIFSDSQLIANQFNGNFRINKVDFLNYFRTAKYHANKAGITSIVWIKRELNKKADELSKIGLHGEDYKLSKNNKRLPKEI